MSFAVALALGFIIGNSIQKLNLAVIASLAAGVLIACVFVLLPFVWNGRQPHPEYVVGAILIESAVFGLLALGGMYLGRRRARKGYGA